MQVNCGEVTDTNLREEMIKEAQKNECQGRKRSPTKTKIKTNHQEKNSKDEAKRVDKCQRHEKQSNNCAIDDTLEQKTQKGISNKDREERA